MEVWIKIQGFTDYEVSNLGNVRSLKYGKIRLLKNSNDNRGYLKNGLYHNNKNKKMLTHRLVALAFIKNIENKPDVKHINGVKTDNRVENLEWCTEKENSVHAVLNGLTNTLIGENQNNSKLNDFKVIEIRKINKSMSQKNISLMFGVSQPLISMILKNKIWNHI